LHNTETAKGVRTRALHGLIEFTREAAGKGFQKGGKGGSVETSEKGFGGGEGLKDVFLSLFKGNATDRGGKTETQRTKLKKFAWEEERRGAYKFPHRKIWAGPR